MKVNDIEVPDAGSTTQYVPDTVGGWMYVVTTSITVDQQNLNDFQAQVDDATAQIAKLQAFVDAAQPQADTLANAVAPVEVSATSTQEIKQ